MPFPGAMLMVESPWDIPYLVGHHASVVVRSTSAEEAVDYNRFAAGIEGRHLWWVRSQDTVVAVQHMKMDHLVVVAHKELLVVGQDTDCKLKHRMKVLAPAQI
jgi:hypothetical protein